MSYLSNFQNVAYVAEWIKSYFYVHKASGSNSSWVTIFLHLELDNIFWVFGVIFFALMSELRLLTYFNHINIVPSTFLTWSGKKLWPSSTVDFFMTIRGYPYVYWRTCFEQNLRINDLRNKHPRQKLLSEVRTIDLPFVFFIFIVNRFFLYSGGGVHRPMCEYK